MSKDLVKPGAALPETKTFDICFGLMLIELTKSVTCENPDIINTMQEHVRKRVKDIKGEGCSVVEDVLAKRIAICELRVSLLEIRLTQAQTVSTQKHVSDELQKANQRLLQACKALASVRRVPNLTLVQVSRGTP